MATITNGKARCITCGKEKSTVRCDGCSHPFCYNHLENHRHELSKQLDDIEVGRDLFQQTLIEQIATPQMHNLIKQIDEWERNAIEKIRQTADDARRRLLKHTTKHFITMDISLDKLSNQLRKSRQENDFFETDLRQWDEQLTQLREELNNPSHIKVIHESTPLINKVSVNISVPLFMVNVSANAKWNQDGVVVAAGNGPGNQFNQLNSPNGLYVDDDDTIYIADCFNHRIVEWKQGATSGEVVAGGKGQGNQNDHLSYPTDVIIDKENDSLIICDGGNRRVMRWPRQNSPDGEIIISNIDCYGLTMDNAEYLYISDFNKHEVRRWKIGEASGTLVAGGNGQGNRLDQLCGPTYICIDQDHSVYVSDQGNHRVMKWLKGAKEGIIVAGGQNRGDNLKRLNYPRGVVVDQLGTVYVADYYNHRIMRRPKGTAQGTIVIGEHGQGGRSNQLNGPWGLSFDRHGNLYVVDYNNHRVQKFHIDPRSNS